MVFFIAAIVGVVVLAHTAPFPFVLDAFHPEGSLWRVKPSPERPKTIYLTFDDGPSAEWTPPLLDVLRDAGVHATFFLIDDHITPETTAIVQRIANEGHAIGLHSGTRRLMILSPATLALTLGRAATRIRDLTGRAPCRLFRPHAGWRSPTMYAGLRRLDYRLAGWSWGMWDWHWWQRPDADKLSARLARKASAGDIVVIHDADHADAHADRRHAGETVRRLVPLLRARGFSFDSLCTMDSVAVTSLIR